jgi:pyruvate formate lyase activating enzyme
MERPLTGKIYDIQGFSVQDGPGIRTTVFMKGCPLRCPWCHSPESQQFHAQLSWMAMRCVGIDKCGKCLKSCPLDAISPGKQVRNAATQERIQHVQIDRSVCNNCGECTSACYPKALVMCGTDYTVEEIADRVSKDLSFYEHSGGGVTISGGEPLCQPEFVSQLLKRLKERGIHTAVDTSGYVQSDIIRRVLPVTDLFLYDLKHMDREKHRIVTGVPNETILENAEQIARAGGRIQVRIPVIPDFNDSEESIRATGLFCRLLGESVILVQLLPYHNLGVMKYQRISEGKVLLEAQPPADEKVLSLKAILDNLGLTTTIH